jgi:hypothetical protein
MLSWYWLFLVYFAACLQRCYKISQYSEIFTTISSIERVFYLCIVLLFLVICKNIRCLDFFTRTVADVELVLNIRPFFAPVFYLCIVLLLKLSDIWIFCTLAHAELILNVCHVSCYLFTMRLSISLLVFWILCCVSCWFVKISKTWNFLQRSLVDIDFSGCCSFCWVCSWCHTILTSILLWFKLIFRR